MVYVAAIEAVALVAVALVFAGVVRSLVRQQARERDLLLNKIMFLAGRTWEAPPVVEPPPTEESFEDYGLTGVIPGEYP